MKKIFTLGALGLLASLGAQAQITLDGRIMASEIGSGLGQYHSIGQFTNPRGFGDWGIKEAFVSEDPNYIYIAIHGTAEANANGTTSGNSFQIYFDVPNFTGAPECVALPAAPTITGDITSFSNMTAAMEMEVDAAVAYKVNDNQPQIELCDYRVATPASVILGPISDQGVASTYLGGAARAAYQNSPTGTVLTNTNEGFEFAVAKAAYSLMDGMDMKIFVVMNNTDGGYLSTDFIPQDPTGGNGNLATGPDFCFDVPGTQYVTYRIGTGLMGLKKVDAASFNFTVAPNPVSGQDASVNFSLDKAQVGSVIVSDMLGRQVAVLAKGTLSAGEQRLTLKAANLAAGQYIVKLQLGDKVATRKLAVQ